MPGGGIRVGRATRPFALTPDDEDLLESSVAQASVAIRNARLHAEARESAGRLRVLSRQLIVVRDDGAGFDVAAVRERARQGASLGLLGLEERVRLAGGAIEIESARGQGTEIRAVFPAGRGERC